MRILKTSFYLGLLLILTLVSCGDGILRGWEEKSDDGLTYLVIQDNNGGECGILFVDGKEWKYGIDVKGRVEPGLHTIECGGAIEFEIKEGTIFYFDYWGP